MIGKLWAKTFIWPPSPGAAGAKPSLPGDVAVAVVAAVSNLIPTLELLGVVAVGGPLARPETTPALGSSSIASNVAPSLVTAVPQREHRATDLAALGYNPDFAAFALLTAWLRRSRRFAC